MQFNIQKKSQERGKIRISQYLFLAISIEYIIITHRESREIIYYKTAGNFNPDFLDTFRSSVQYDILDLPMEEGKIEQATLEGKYLISRAGKKIWISLVLNKIPTLFTREVLKFFCEIFEGQYRKEILELYTRFQGDISIFRRQSKLKQSVEDIIEDIFHLHLTLPFKLGSTKGKKLSSKSKKIYQHAKVLSHKIKGGFLLEKLFDEISKSFKISNEELAELIFKLVQTEVFIALPSEKRKRKFSIHL
ncbi:MAG: hypothetical protein ACFFA0_09305 [Promethearchaeota archaeon]